MMTPLAGLLTFILMVVVLGWAYYMFIGKQYFDTYEIRVRPRKKNEASSATAPKESAILNTARTAGNFVTGLLPQVVDERTTKLLIHANYRTPEHLATYIGIKSIIVGALVLFMIIGSSGNIVSLLLVVPVALVAWIMPNFFLTGRVRKRQNAIVMELPTVIDLLIVCAQAGLGLLMCIDKVSKEVGDTCPNIAAEFGQLLQDVKIFAKSSSNALKDMAERCGVDELTSMTSALISAEAKGSDISYPLHQQADALRDRIKRKKEEEAAKVPVKMVPVIMVFIMPLILAPMLGPAVITIMESLKPMTGK